jgi:hypothetical protein
MENEALAAMQWPLTSWAMAELPIIHTILMTCAAVACWWSKCQ